jgi:hypothetical protein
MAFFDFLGKDIGGYTSAPQVDTDFLRADNNTPIGNTGITWGKLISTLASTSSSPTTKVLGGIAGQQGSQQVPIFDISKHVVPQQQKQQGDSTGAAVGIISKFLGF